MTKSSLNPKLEESLQEILNNEVHVHFDEGLAMKLEDVIGHDKENRVLRS